MKRTYSARYAVVVTDKGPSIFFPDFNSLTPIDTFEISNEALAYSALLDLVRTNKNLPSQPLHIFPFISTVKKWLRMRGYNANEAFVDHGLVTVTWEDE